MRTAILAEEPLPQRASRMNAKRVRMSVKGCGKSARRILVRRINETSHLADIESA
jgi:hypothetical protein